MADKKISQLPFLPLSGIGATDLVPLVSYFSAATGDTVHTYVNNLKSFILSGATDIFVTGGTFVTSAQTLNLVRDYFSLLLLKIF
mgnify:CR=1 FL=1